MGAPTMLPTDQANTTLLANVHPSEWTNPTPTGRYNLVVIGGGTAGLISAAIASSLGARTALIERGLLGGDCLNVGCVPSKGVIRGARAAAELAWINAQGLTKTTFPQPGTIDFGAVMERMRTIRSQISSHDSAARYRDEFGVDIFIGNATFTGRDSLNVVGDDGSTRDLRFSRSIIAAGARAAAPPIPGLDSVDYLTNESIFTLTELPQRLHVIGAGPIGSEMAQSFARFGCAVELYEMAPRVLPREDTRAAEIVQESMIAAGVHLHTGVRVEAIEPGASPETGSIRSRASDDTESVSEPGRILVALGRAPNIDGLDLEAAGVKYHRRGVTVNSYLQTSNRRIYAIGDVAIPFQFTHMAEASAAIAVQNALFFRTKKLDPAIVPWCTYTSPELAHVGLSEKQATEQGITYQSYIHQMGMVDRARLDGETEGFAQLLVGKKGKILGATIVAAHAGDLLGEIVLAMQNKLPVGALSAVIHPYPTQGEAVKRAASGYLKEKLTPRVAKMMRWWFARRR